MTDEPTCVSLFSGIGGLDYGLHRAGFRHLLMCESDPWRRDVLRALSHGSNPNSNAAGRRREDDENLLIEPYTFDWQAGGGGSDDSFRGKSRAWIDDKPGRARSLVKNKTLAVHTEASVRRLTPTECERLQALPDGWTDLGGTPDSRRYAALGDAVTASVSYWIGCRIRDAA